MKLTNFKKIKTKTSFFENPGSASMPDDLLTVDVSQFRSLLHSTPAFSNGGLFA